MIKEFEYHHGIVFSRILHFFEENVCVRPYPSQDNASYVINDNIGIYIKYSTKRLTPWRFSFLKRHQDEILDMKNKFGSVFLLLVCNNDGIVALSFDDLKSILNEAHDEVEWISVSRHRREMYSVSGSDGDLKFKIGRSDFPAKLFKDPKSKVKGGIFSWLN
jgi:hypothetical protein